MASVLDSILYLPILVAFVSGEPADAFDSCRCADFLG